MRRLTRSTRLALELAWAAARQELSIIMGLQLASGLALTGELLVGRLLLEELLGDGNVPRFQAFLPELVALLALAVVSTFTAAAAAERERIMGELVERHALGRIIDVSVNVPYRLVEDPAFHDQLQRARHNALTRPWQLVAGLTNIASALFALVGVLFVLASVAWWLPFSVVAAFVPLGIATNRNGRTLFDFAFSLSQEDRERRYLEGALTGITEAKEVRVLGAGRALRARYDTLYEQRVASFRDVVRRRLRRSLLATSGTTLITVGSVAVLLWMTTRPNPISLAEAGIAVAGVQQVGSRLRALGAGSTSLLECSLFLDDLGRFLDDVSHDVASSAQAAVPVDVERVALSDVSFSYPGRDELALDAVSLHVARGEVIALVGPNGSGKTTLVKLLCGLYVPSSGRITWDGADVLQLDPAAVRRSLSVIFQDFVRYQMSVRHNVAIGRYDDADDDAALSRALADAGAQSVVAPLAHGVDTLLTPTFEGGTELSGGEWQRIAIARALFRAAPILVLDEPSSSLDAEAERQIFDTVRRAASDKAVILVSHRMGTVRAADRIYVLNEGKIVAVGSHHDLLATEPLYAALGDRPDLDQPAPESGRSEP